MNTHMNTHMNKCGKCNYKTGAECHCKSKPCAIEPVILNQGPNKGIPYKKIDNIPLLEIAVLSNDFCDMKPDSVIALNPIVISWCDFLTLFYGGNKNFVVSPSNIFTSCITFNAQSYENVSRTMKYNLAEQVKAAWAEKCETMISNLPIKKSILLNKDTFLIRSLASACSLTALSLDEAMNTLIGNNQIVPGCYNTEAVVQFVVSYKYYFQPLDTCVQVNFTYLTKIPHFKNVDCDGECPPYYYYYYYYSEECVLRSNIDITHEDDVLSYIKDDYFFMDDNSSLLTCETSSDNASSKW